MSFSIENCILVIYLGFLYYLDGIGKGSVLSCVQWLEQICNVAYCCIHQPNAQFLHALSNQRTNPLAADPKCCLRANREEGGLVDRGRGGGKRGRGFDVCYVTVWIKHDDQVEQSLGWIKASMLPSLGLSVCVCWAFGLLMPSVCVCMHRSSTGRHGTWLWTSVSLSCPPSLRRALPSGWVCFSIYQCGFLGNFGT